MSTHDFTAGDDPAQGDFFTDSEETEPKTDRPEGRRYREAPIRAVGLPEDFVEQVGGPFTVCDTFRTDLFAAARAAYLMRRTAASEAEVLEYPESRFPWLEDMDFHAVKGKGTIIKSLQGFAEDIWRRIYKQALPEGNPLDTEEFELLYDRTRRSIQRSVHLRNKGPAVPHENKFVRDLHGRRLSLSPKLEAAAQGRPAPLPPPFVRCAGPRASDERNLWSRVEQRVARREDFHRALSKAVVASRVDGRRRTANGRRFEKKHERQATDRPQYISVGRWRPGEAERQDQEDCAVRVPWLIADIDSPFRKGRRWCVGRAQVLLRLLGKHGADLSNVSVAYSGNCSVHVRIPDGTIGCPVYQNARAAADAIERFFEGLCQGEETLRDAIDGNLFYPGHLIRVIGSVHPRTGRRVVGTDGETFLEKPPEFLFSHAEREFQYSRPERYPLPRRAAFSPPLSRLHTPPDTGLNTPPKGASSGEPKGIGVRQSESVYEGGNGSGVDRGLVLDRVRGGVEKGEDWGTDADPRYVGRNWASLFVSHEQLRKKAGPARAWRAVRDWNERNDPPLDERELKAVFKRALEYRSPALT